jgi:histidinol dehydrogenase
MPVLKITQLDSQRDDASAFVRQLRGRLGVDGSIVSEEGRRRTMALFGQPLSPQQVVERICTDVAHNGLRAVLDYSARIDGSQLTALSLRVPEADLRQAEAAVDPCFLQTLDRIIANIRAFQQQTLPGNVQLVRETPAGGRITLAQRSRPLARVGVCVPGGAAAYPSTLLMTAVPAQVAGVRQIVVVAPPTPFGAYNQELLAACARVGITEVYRVGGAQAVAMLAHGVEGVPAVDKIVGPGNLFVALAKRHVYGRVDIDAIAGPSEVVVLADASAKARFVASDLISQAEHSPGASMLVTWHKPLTEQVLIELERQLAQVDRGNLARESLSEYGALITCRSADEALDLCNQLAPEHLHLSVERPEELLPEVQNAGAIFLGHFTPVALGDYVAGPSHVLPTGGTARFASGLCASDFLKRSSVIGYDLAAAGDAAEDVRRMARVEGLTAHAASVDVRLQE